MQQKDQQLNIAKEKEKSANEAVVKAQGDQQQAQQQARLARQKRQKAEQERKIAVAGLTIAKQRQQEARKQTEQAQHQRRKAQQLAQTAENQRKNAEAQRNIALTAIRLVLAGVRTFGEVYEGGQIENLVEIMRTGKEFKSLVKDKQSLADYPAYSPLFSLQEILLNIRERNQLEGHQDYVNSVAFSPDGKTLASAS